MFVDGNVQRGDCFHKVLTWREVSQAVENILFVKDEIQGGRLRGLRIFRGRSDSTEEMREIERRLGFEEMEKKKSGSLVDVKELNQFLGKAKLGAGRLNLPFSEVIYLIG